MKRNLTGLSRRYGAALRKHLKHGARAGLEPARELGRLAMAVGLGTLELARIHDQTLLALAAGLSPRRPTGHDQAGGKIFCRGHHPD